MSTTQPPLRQIFRVTVDIEVRLHSAGTPDGMGQLPYEQALIREMMANPEVLHRYFQSCAVGAMQQVQSQLEREYGWSSVSENALLEPIISKLQPAAQRYFLEDTSDDDTAQGVTQYSVDICDANVVGFTMTRKP